MQRKTVFIRGALCALPDGASECTIAVWDGKITSIGRFDPPDGAEIVEANGLVALPGAVDSHVHFHMPTADGGFNADDFLTGSTCAICGGTTTVVDFASPFEGKGWTEGVRRRRAEADGKIFCDYGLHMEVTGAFEQDITRLGELADAGVKVLKIYTTYGSDRYPREKLPALFREAKRLSLRILAHCEDDEIIQETKRRMLAAVRTGASLHAESRPAAAEAAAVRELIELAEQTGTELIIAHVSTGEAGELVAKARKRGVAVYAETCPHYLLLTEELYADKEPQRYIMTPPLRTANDNALLWELLASGDIGMASTDHCPFLLEQKLAEPTCFGAVPGVGGCENLVSLLFSEGYQKGRLSLPQLAWRLAGEAARLYGFAPEKGALMEGADADIVLIDPNAPHVLTAQKEHSNAGYSIWEGFRVGCTVRRVYLHGELVSTGGEPVGSPSGKYLFAK